MIDDFTGEYAFLSNFFESPVTYGGLTFKNSEAAFQSMKFADPALRVQFTDLCDADAKRLGKSIPLRRDWILIRTTIMSAVVHAKFEQNPALMRMLLDTGDEELVEGNNWRDNVWGDCKCPKCTHIPGQNILGRILMFEREYWQRRTGSK